MSGQSFKTNMINIKKKKTKHRYKIKSLYNSFKISFVYFYNQKKKEDLPLFLLSPS